MKDKISQVCDYILDKIESGEYPTGEAIPAARKLTGEVDASFAMVQHAVNTLSSAGILRSISRQGTVVREDWAERLMPNHLFVFKPMSIWILRPTSTSFFRILRCFLTFRSGISGIRMGACLLCPLFFLLA